MHSFLETICYATNGRNCFFFYYVYILTPPAKHQKSKSDTNNLLHTSQRVYVEGEGGSINHHGPDQSGRNHHHTAMSIAGYSKGDYIPIPSPIL